MQAVVFDLDGTIMDTEGVHAQALDDVVRSKGMRGRAEGYVGLTDRQALALIFDDNGAEPDTDAMIALIEEKTTLVVERMRESPLKPYPGAVDLVRACAEIVPVAVCTASSSHEALHAIEEAGIRDALTAIITCCDVDQNKPHPMGYRLAVERLGAEPASAIAIEDSRNGLTAARNAGLFTIALRHTCPEDHLELAHEIVDSIANLTPEQMASLLASHNDYRDRQGAGFSDIPAH